MTDKLKKLGFSVCLDTITALILSPSGLSVMKVKSAFAVVTGNQEKLLCR